MTTDQRKEYNKLTKEQKEDFRFHAKRHPEWTFKMLMIKVRLDDKFSDTITNIIGAIEYNTDKVPGHKYKSDGHEWCQDEITHGISQKKIGEKRFHKKNTPDNSSYKGEYNKWEEITWDFYE